MYAGLLDLNFRLTIFSVCLPPTLTDILITTPKHRDLAPQPSKLADFIPFKLLVKDVWQSRENLSGQRPAQLQEMYSVAADWAPTNGGRIPHNDQVILCDTLPDYIHWDCFPMNVAELDCF